MKRLSCLLIPVFLIAAPASAMVGCDGNTVDLGGKASNLEGAASDGGAATPPVVGEPTSDGTVEPNVDVSVRLADPEAGIDYPTDAPLPASLVGKKILILDEPQTVDARIVVDGSAQLQQPTAGIDYPTDASKPAALEKATILVLHSTDRLVISIKAAVAGVDFPTDAPTPPFKVWAFNTTTRLAIRDIASIVKAEAGVDFPTDAPSENDYVAVMTAGDRHKI